MLILFDFPFPHILLFMRHLTRFLASTLLFLPLTGIAQRHRPKAAPQPPTEEELRSMALQQRYDEMLTGTRSITVIDSLVTDKDAFLSAMRLTHDAGRFSEPGKLFHADAALPPMGKAAFVNALSSAVYYTQADTAGQYQLWAAFRNGPVWSSPSPLEGLGTYAYADFPFVQADGVTLYFSAESDDGLGGLDLYVTRFNQETGKYVRPENMGLPYNSPANDYLFATDETAGVALLVTDRSQPADKVCLYWISIDSVFEGAPYRPASPVSPDATETEADTLQLRAYAALSSIAATQSDVKAVERVRRQWHDALAEDAQAPGQGVRFIINDRTIYHSLSEFKNADARRTAEEWQEALMQKRAVESELSMLRKNYASLRSEKTRLRIQGLESAAAENLRVLHRLEKLFRQQEIAPDTKE